MALLFDIMEI